MMLRALDGALKARAAKVIPNGMYGHESTAMLPASYPQYFSRAKGAYIWDVDGNRYLDFMCAYGPNLLGYGDPRVDAAAARQQVLGDALTGPSPVMVELAETLVSMVTHADWAMFCKNGTDATTMAKSVARAQTGRRIVIVAQGAYHGSAPWCTPNLTGTLPEDRAFLRTCLYNNVASLEAAVAAAGDDLAAIFASPFKHDAFFDQQALDPAYALRARELCDATGAMLVVDEVRAGFRLARDCSWSLAGVRPDLSSWGKGIANGYPLSVLLGSNRCRDGAGSIYMTGSFWFAAVPMAAAIETLRILRETHYIDHLQRIGERLRNGFEAAAERHGFELRQTGPVQIPQMLFNEDPDFRIGFAWAEEMLRRGIYIHPWHNMFLCAAMTEADMDVAIEAADASLASLAPRRAKLEAHPAITSRLRTRLEAGA